MTLNKQKGNMYGWVTHTWNPVKGVCPHQCSYCYMKRYWERMSSPRLVDNELKKYFGEKYENFRDNLFIFAGSSIDLFADKIPDEWIEKSATYCSGFPENQYLFQSKNPNRFYLLEDYTPKKLFKNITIGTTLETNRSTKEISKAPKPIYRAIDMCDASPFKKMITIEPIMDFDLKPFLEIIKEVSPEWVNIGADSGGNNLPEPSSEKVKMLIKELKKFTEVRMKSNLERILR